jgi:shikimate dehydrogenase
VRNFGLIGFPLEHSFSPQFFASKFKQESVVDVAYNLYPLRDISEFPELLSKIRFSGLNVTLPYKEKVIPYLDALSHEAQMIGAVNCIEWKENKLIGHNTDAEGFRRSIKPFLENKYERALIIGTGGSSKAIAYVLSQWSMPFIYISRHPQGDHQIHPLDVTAELLEHFKLIINTSPVGMHPQVNEMPAFPFHLLNETHFYFDLIYNPEVTMSMKIARERGSLTMNGYNMLAIQALESWRIWNATANG